MLRLRYAWASVAATVLFRCSTDTFTADAGPDDSSADATHADAGPDASVDDAVAGDTGGSDAFSSGCPFDGAVVRPAGCTPSCVQANAQTCCVEVDAGMSSCGTAVCTPGADSFGCFTSSDCTAGKCCFSSPYIDLLYCPRRLSQKSGTTSSCATTCNSGAVHTCSNDSDCTALQRCSAITLPGFLFQTGLCL